MASAAKVPAPTIGTAQVERLIEKLVVLRFDMLRTSNHTVWCDTGRAAALAAHDLFEHAGLYELAKDIAADIGVDIDGDPIRDDGFVSAVVERHGSYASVTL